MSAIGCNEATATVPLGWVRTQWLVDLAKANSQQGGWEVKIGIVGERF